MPPYVWCPTCRERHEPPSCDPKPDAESRAEEAGELRAETGSRAARLRTDMRGGNLR